MRRFIESLTNEHWENNLKVDEMYSEDIKKSKNDINTVNGADVENKCYWKQIEKRKQFTV